MRSNVLVFGLPQLKILPCNKSYALFRRFGGSEFGVDVTLRQRIELGVRVTQFDQIYDLIICPLIKFIAVARAQCVIGRRVEVFIILLFVNIDVSAIADLRLYVGVHIDQRPRTGRRNQPA